MPEPRDFSEVLAGAAAANAEFLRNPIKPYVPTPSVAEPATQPDQARTQAIVAGGAWRDLADRAISLVEDAVKDTSWGQPAVGPDFGEELREKYSALATQQPLEADVVEALRGAMDILTRAESNASGNPEWDYVGPRVQAVRTILAKIGDAA